MLELWHVRLRKWRPRSLLHGFPLMLIRSLGEESPAQPGLTRDRWRRQRPAAEQQVLQFHHRLRQLPGRLLRLRRQRLFHVPMPGLLYVRLRKWRPRSLLHGLPLMLARPLGEVSPAPSGLRRNRWRRQRPAARQQEDQRPRLRLLRRLLQVRRLQRAKVAPDHQRVTAGMEKGRALRYQAAPRPPGGMLPKFSPLSTPPATGPCSITWPRPTTRW